MLNESCFKAQFNTLHLNIPRLLDTCLKHETSLPITSKKVNYDWEMEYCILLCTLLSNGWMWF